MRNRNEDKDKSYNLDFTRNKPWIGGDMHWLHSDEHTAPLRKDLRSRVLERERRAVEEAEFNKAMNPQPYWVRNHKGSNPMEAYCLKCRASREISAPEEVTLKNGRLATRGKCAICETSVIRFSKS